MAKLYFKYGNGKSADLCQTAYNYGESNHNVIVMNADDNKEIISKYQNDDGTYPLRRSTNMEVGSELFERIYDYNKIIPVSCVLVDNSQFLSVQNAEDLFFVVNTLGIDVIVYGDRTLKGGETSPGSMRTMELANNIEEIDREFSKSLSRISGAKLEFYTGAMNSSKTAKLLYILREMEAAGLNVFLMRPSKDRDATKVTSRIGMQAEADFIIDENTKIYGEGEYLLAKHINYILVDEAQFLNIGQINELRRIVNDFNIPIRCYGLKVDFLGYHFPGSGRLLELSDSLVKLKTICTCGKGAGFNARIDSHGNFVTSGSQVEIDNGGNYISICPECFIRNVMYDKVPAKVRSKVLK